MKEKIVNPKEYTASTGDRFELHFNILSVPLLNDIQRSLILKRLSKMTQIKVENIVSSDRDLAVTISVIKNPLPLGLVIGGVLTVLAGFFVWASLGEVYKITQTPASTFLFPAILVAVVLGVIKLAR